MVGGFDRGNYSREETIQGRENILENTVAALNLPETRPKCLTINGEKLTFWASFPYAAFYDCARVLLFDAGNGRYHDRIFWVLLGFEHH